MLLRRVAFPDFYPASRETARAQQAGKLRTIGFLGPNAHSAANEWVAALAQRLRDVET
jgi:hypothetical protein